MCIRPKFGSLYNLIQFGFQTLMNRIREANSPHRMDPTHSHDSTFGDYQQGGCLSNWLQMAAFGFIGKSISKPLQISDMRNLGQQYDPELNARSHAQFNNSDRKQKQHRLRFSLFFQFKGQLIYAAFLSIVSAGFALSSPLIIKSILSFLLNMDATMEGQNQAIVLSACWAVGYILKIFIRQYSNGLFFQVSVKCEQILVIQIYNKILRLSPAYKKYLQKGDLLNHLIADVKYVITFVRSMDILFSCPTTIIAVQFLLFLEVELYGFALLFVLMVALLVQLRLDNLMSKCRSHKLKAMQERIQFNLQIFSSIRQVKTLGWQDFITNKNQHCRVPENLLNKQYFTYSNLFDLVINLIPFMVILLIYILQIFIQGAPNFNTVTLFLILSYVSLIYGPFKSLLVAIVNAFDSYLALNRIEHLLNAEEKSDGYTTDELQPGQIIINQLVCSWDSQNSKRHFELRDRLNTFHNNQIDNQSEHKQQITDIALDHKRNINLHARSFAIPFYIDLEKGQRLLLVGEPNSGKSTFIESLLGNTVIEKGEIRHNGRIAYLSQKLWLRKMSIKDNILFGEPVNYQFLKKVYKWAELEPELDRLPKGQNTVISDTCDITETQKRKICLARAFYSNADILLLDDVFNGEDVETIKILYERICKHLGNKTVIISTRLTHFINCQDKVLLFKRGKAIQYGQFGKLSKCLTSQIHKLVSVKKDIATEHHQIHREHHVKICQMIIKERRRSEVRMKFQKAVKSVIRLLRMVGKNKLQHHMKQEAALIQVKRAPRMPFAYYAKFINAGSPYYYITVAILTVITSANKVFLDWWFMNVKILPFSDVIKEVSYVALVLSFGLLFSLTANLVPKLSVINTENHNNELCRSVGHKAMDWFETQNTIKVAGVLTRDNQQIFIINNLLQNILRNSSVFVGYIVIICTLSPYFILVVGFVVFWNAIVMKYLMQAERQMNPVGIQFNDNLNKIYDETLNGVTNITAFRKENQVRSELSRFLYKNSVYRIHYKFISHAMGILSELSSMFIILAVVIYSIKNKFSMQSEQLTQISLCISLSLKIADLITSVCKDISNLEISIETSLKLAYSIIDIKPEEGYDLPQQPVGWPANSQISFDNVSLRYHEVNQNVVEDLNLVVNAGQNIVLCGSDTITNNIIFKSITKLVKPTPKNSTCAVGKILIGGQDIDSIGRKYVSKVVSHLTPLPFIVTGTLRENLDPFQDYSDFQIKEALEKICLWDEIEVDYETEADELQQKLDFYIEDAGSNLGLAMLQKINIARAILRKPLILLVDSITSSLDSQAKEQVHNLIKTQFQQATLLLVTENANLCVQSDQVLYITNGKVVEAGKPLDLLSNPQSHFCKYIRNASQIQEVKSRSDLKSAGQLKKTQIKNNKARIRHSIDMQNILSFLV